MTGMRKPNVCRALRWLTEKNVIIRRDNGVGSTYQFNKYYEQWGALSRQITKSVISSDNPIISSDNEIISSDNEIISSDNRTFIKENNKENNKEKTRLSRQITQTSKKLYDYYNKIIKPKRKSAVRAKKNIAHHLKHHTTEDLKKSVENYNTIKPDGQEYRKDPANFFGRTEPYFEDYLPGNYDAPEGDSDAKYREFRERMGKA
jgi:predicted transcriptional regulator